MRVETPASAAELSALLRDCQPSNLRIEIAGSRTKLRMGGPVVDADVRIETKALNRVLQFDPRDLTISVEAGIRFSELSKLLAENKLFIPIEAPFAADATVGGILATHSAGHRRRLFGTVRDLVIGMQFNTLNGRDTQSGGMVVKNVAGLDFAKLLTGSFGTLACISKVNFKLMPAPKGSKTFLLQNVSASDVFNRRNEILKSVLQPSAIDILNPVAANTLGLPARWSLLIEALGSEAVLARYQKELPGFQVIHNEIWDGIREFTPNWLSAHPAGHVLRLSTMLMEMESVMTKLPADQAVIGRAGNGVIYSCTPAAATIPAGIKGAIEFSPAQRQSPDQLWPTPGNDFPLMQKIKHYFDPNNLLNPGRLYGRI
jgi:glycolate oxidase FAD binding subunit